MVVFRLLSATVKPSRGILLYRVQMLFPAAGRWPVNTVVSLFKTLYCFWGAGHVTEGQSSV